MTLTDELFKLINKTFTSPKEPIYHYTNEINYSEICRSGHFKLNSHIYLNEKNAANRELEIAIALIVNMIEENRMENALIDRFLDYTKRGVVYYTTSFSKIKSHTLACKYGDYCLELSTKPMIDFKKNRLTLFSSILYDKVEQKKLMEQLFEQYRKYKASSIDHESQLNQLITALSTIMPLLKTSKDEHDEECRIVQIEGFDPVTKEKSTPFIKKYLAINPEADILKVKRYFS